MDVGALRKILKRDSRWRRLQDHVTMLSEAEGAPIGRAFTNAPVFSLMPHEHRPEAGAG